MKIIVIGGGIIGTAAALRLRDRGANVTVLERAVIGAEASTVAAGILGGQVEAHDEAQLRTFVRARDGYASFVADLEQRTGIAVGHKVCGIVKLVENEARARKDCDLHASLGLRAELLQGPEVREVEPSVAEDRRLALFFPDDAQVEPERLLRALTVAAHAAGVTVRTGAHVTGLVVSGGACRGVSVGSETIGADAVVLAAGSWASLVPGVPSETPRVTPARGQIVALEQRPARTKRIVFHEGGYVVPRGDGRVLCGSTVEHVGYEKAVTAKGLVDILSTACSAVPSLASATLSGTASNFRPLVRDADGPLVGASNLAGLHLATGHYRNGILLANETASAVVSAVLGH